MWSFGLSVHYRAYFICADKTGKMSLVPSMSYIVVGQYEQNTIGPQ